MALRELAQDIFAEKSRRMLTMTMTTTTATATAMATATTMAHGQFAACHSRIVPSCHYAIIREMGDP